MRLQATIAVAALVLSAGSAVAASKTIDLPGFTAVDISSGIDAQIVVGGPQSISAESPDAGVLDELQIRVDGGVLRASFDWSIFDVFRMGRDRQITLHITVPTLTEAEASSGADVSITGMSGNAVTLSASSGAGLAATGISATSFDLQASSGASLAAEGTCVRATVEVSSGADIAAAALLCEDVTAEASSGAHAAVFASKSMKAEASSGAGIVVHGNPPQFEDETSSGGDVSAAR